MKKILLLFATTIANAPLMGMKNQVNPLPPPPPYNQFIASHQQESPPTTNSHSSTATQTDEYYAPQQNSAPPATSNQIPTDNLLALYAAQRGGITRGTIQALNFSSINQPVPTNQNPSSFCTMHEETVDQDRCGIVCVGCIATAILAPPCALLDLVTMPGVYWRRTHTPSNAGRNQYCYGMRNIIALCGGIQTMQITGSDPDRVDYTINCGTRTWNDTSGD